MNKIMRRFLGLAAMLAAGASVGSASSISYWVDVFSSFTTAQLCVGPCPAGNTSTLATGGGPNVNLTIPEFNQLGNAAEGTPSPGNMFVLTNVALTLDWQATGTVTVYNFYSTNLPFNNAQASTNMTLTSGTDTVNTTGTAASGAGTAICCNILNGTPIFLGQTNINGLTGTGSTTGNDPNLSFYEGFSNNTFSASISTNSVNVTGSSSDPHASQLAYQGTGQMGAIATITYSYAEQAIPEPVTSTLVGGALLGLGLLVRRRRATEA